MRVRKGTQCIGLWVTARTRWSLCPQGGQMAADPPSPPPRCPSPTAGLHFPICQMPPCGLWENSPAPLSAQVAAVTYSSRGLTEAAAVVLAQLSAIELNRAETQAGTLHRAPSRG